MALPLKEMITTGKKILGCRLGNLAQFGELIKLVSDKQVRVQPTKAGDNLVKRMSTMSSPRIGMTRFRRTLKLNRLDSRFGQTRAPFGKACRPFRTGPFFLLNREIHFVYIHFRANSSVSECNLPMPVKDRVVTYFLFFLRSL